MSRCCRLAGNPTDCFNWILAVAWYSGTWRAIITSMITMEVMKQSNSSQRRLAIM